MLQLNHGQTTHKTHNLNLLPLRLFVQNGLSPPSISPSLSPLLAYLTADDKQAGWPARRNKEREGREAETVPFILQGDTTGWK